MPGFNGTGPSGAGPMTGRGRGFCALTASKENPDKTEGFAGVQGEPAQKTNGNSQFVGRKTVGRWLGRCFGRGLGLGQGFGRGCGRGRANTFME